jgi:hypothetical protein
MTFCPASDACTIKVASPCPIAISGGSWPPPIWREAEPVGRQARASRAAVSGAAPGSVASSPAGAAWHVRWAPRDRQGEHRQALGQGARAAAAHLRYLQRDGTTREGERGQLYGRDEDVVDGKAFLEKGAEDRHQFRFIVSPEDGDRYEDLKP